MSASIEITQGNLALSSSITKWMLAGSGVLFLFGMGTFLHLAHRRKVEGVSSLEDSRVQSSLPRVRPSTKISYPASGIHRSRVYYARREEAPSKSASPASSSIQASAGSSSFPAGPDSEIELK